MPKFFRRLLLPVLFLFSQSSFAQNFNLQLRDQLTYPVGLSNLWGYVDDSGNEYALVGTYNKLSIVNVSDPDNVVQLFALPHTGSDWCEIKTWNKHAYATNESGGGLLIADLSQLPDTVTYHYFTDGGLNTAHTIWIDENGIMYLFGYNLTPDDIPSAQRGALVYDLNSDPDNPVYLGNFNDKYIHDGFVRGDTLWASHVYDGQLGIYDVTDKDNFVQIGLKSTPLNFTHNSWPTSDNHFVFTTDEKPNSSLTSYDVSDLGNITELDQAKSNPGSNVIIHNVHLTNNDFAAVSYYRDGVVIFDVSQPDNMIEVGSYDTSPIAGDGFNGCWGVYPYLPSGNWLVSDIENGLFVLSPTLQKAARLQGIVTDSITNLPINNVNVTILGTDNSDQSDVDGLYKTGNATAGTFLVKFEVFGYVPRIVSVSLINDNTVTLNMKLVPAVGFQLVIQTVDQQSGLPIAASQASVTDYGLYQFNITTDANGESTIATYPSEYDAIVGAWGYKTQLVNLGNIDNTDTVTVQLTKDYYDDFYFDFGWTHTQTATAGHWVRGVPIGTTDNGTFINPGSDLVGDFGTQCYITGNGGGAAGEDDIDAGEVVLTSPLFNAATYTDPYVRYYRWFANAGGGGPQLNDSMVVMLSNGVTSVVVETVTAAQNASELSQWAHKTFHIADYITPTADMQISYRVVDATPGHWVEGAVDVFEVVEAAELGVENIIENNGWTLYPNPTLNQLLLSYQGDVPGTYKIISITGAVINNGTLNTNGITSINTSSLSSGFYMVLVDTNTGRNALHFIKQ